MSRGLESYYQLREIAESKNEPVFLHCLHGFWSCQVGYDFKNSGTNKKIGMAIKEALTIYNDSTEGK